jgi:hypothetical protein
MVLGQPWFDGWEDFAAQQGAGIGMTVAQCVQGGERDWDTDKLVQAGGGARTSKIGAKHSPCTYER